MTSLRCGFAICLALTALMAVAPSAAPFSTRPITETATCHLTGDGLSTAVYDGISLSDITFLWAASDGNGGFTVITSVTVPVRGSSGSVSRPTPANAAHLDVSFDSHSPHSQGGVQV